jgi:uncharacterized protein (TIGR02246 family)
MTWACAVEYDVEGGMANRVVDPAITDWSAGNYEWEGKPMDMRKILEDFDEAYNEAFNKGDAAGCASFFAEDVVLLAPGQPMTRGRKAFEEIYRSRMSQSTGATHSNQLVGYGVDGELAYQIGTFAITGTDSPDQGKFVNVLKRQADGSWKVAVSIFNSDGP